jgi:hypothetical protein
MFTPKTFAPIIKIILIAVVLEVSLFNIRHWATIGVGPSTNVNNYTVNLGDYVYLNANGAYQAVQANARLTITDIDSKIRTVRIVPDFGDGDIKMTEFEIIYGDENQRYSYTAQVLNGYECSYYIPLGAMGEVDSLAIVFINEAVAVKEVEFNAPLPWRFQGLRVLLLVIAVTAIYYGKKYRFGSILFEPELVWQKRLEAGIVALHICLLLSVKVFATDIGYIPGSGRELTWLPYSQDIYNEMTEAVLLRQVHLNIVPDESLINAAFPYDRIYRYENDVVAPWDHAYYNGKIYSYFGIVPVFVLYLPHKLIFEDGYLTSDMATAVFCTFAVIGLFLFWRELAKRYLPKIPYAVYLASLLAVLFGSNLMLLAVMPLFYAIPVSSGFMFVTWGLFFILRSIGGDSLDKLKTAPLFFGALFLALAVGCRPPLLVASLLVPVLLWPILASFFPLKEKLKDKHFVRIALIKIIALAIPYLVIGLALMWYNYVRFDSIMEFGASYQISYQNSAAATDTGLLGNMRRSFDGMMGYLFTPFNIYPDFPFIRTGNINSVFTGFMSRDGGLIGAFALPVTWFLPAAIFIRKSPVFRNVAPLIIGMAAVSLTILLAETLAFPYFTGRYSADFFWLLMVSGNLCAGLLYAEALAKSQEAAAVVGRLHLIAVIISCFILFNWGMIGDADLLRARNPVVVRYISDMLMIF